MSQQFNPLAPLGNLGTMARQGIEQINLTNKSLSDGLASTATNLLTALPGGNGQAPGGGGGQASGLPGLPMPQNLFPQEAANAVSQIEEVAIPQGFPRPSQMLGLRSTRRRATVEEQPAAETSGADRETRAATTSPVQGQVRERRGY